MDKLTAGFRESEASGRREPMKDVFLIYDRCCFYEIVILSYFMSYSGCNVAFCSTDGKPVRAMEGFSVNADMSLDQLDRGQVRSLILPGGGTSEVDNAAVRACLLDLKERGAMIAGICAGVDVLERAGVLRDVSSTHSTGEDLVSDRNVITARANAYVDFAVEAARKLGLFASEEDLRETVGFWKHYKRVQ